MSGEQRRRQILEAARRAFSRRGDVAGTRTKDIAAEAGVSEGIIYRHFDSKDELFYEAAVLPLREAFELGEDRMRQLMPDLPGADRHELAVAYYREMITMLSDLIPLLGLVLFGEPGHADEFYRDVLEPALDELGERWQEAHRRISGRDEKPSRYRTLAHFGVALIFALDQRRSEHPPDIDELAEKLAREGYAPLGYVDPSVPVHGRDGG